MRFLRRSTWAWVFGLVLCFSACGDSSSDLDPATATMNSSMSSATREVLPPNAPPSSAAGSGGTAPTAITPAQPPGTSSSIGPSMAPQAGPSPPAGAPTPNQPPENLGDDTRSSTAEVTYHKQIRGLLETNCLSCHVNGGIGPFALDDWGTVKQVASTVVAAVKSRIMPPWPADTSCHSIRDSRALTDEQLELFAKWQAENFPEGDPKDYVPPPTAAAELDIGPATRELDAGMKYTPPNNADDYRCFLTDHVFETDTYLKAVDIVPDQRAEVHHVQVHRLTAAQRAQLQATDAASPGSGYPCNSGLVLSQNMFSWRPGGTRVTFDPGDAAYIEAGSSIMLQVHYNTQFLPAGQSPTPDQTKVLFWTLAAGELPDRVIYRTGVTAGVTVLPGEQHSVSEANVSMLQLASVGPTRGFVPGEIIGMTPHAHQIASEMTSGITKGGAEQCLIDVPKWDFNWQLDYLFSEGVPYSATDTIRATCVYDNSAGHQPLVDGVQQQPRLVTFGEGSLDEMCLHYVWLRMDRKAFLGR